MWVMDQVLNLRQVIYFHFYYKINKNTEGVCFQISILFVF